MKLAKFSVLLVAAAAFFGAPMQMGCKGPLPPVSSTTATATIDTGCSLIGILDSSGSIAATICEAVAPVVGPIVSAVINDLGGDKVLGSQQGLRFTSIAQGGKVIGYARAEIAAAVQTKIDAAK